MIKLLIVDDSALMRRQLVALFQGEDDFEIHQARNGKEAVAENREFQPDVITLDINMPEMDGIEFVGNVRTQNPSIPILMVTTNAAKEDIVAALQAGVNNYVVKPFTPETLKEKIESLLG